MRRALVTGGANGIGWATCRKLVTQGYRVAIADIDIEAAQSRVTELGPCNVALGVDLTDRGAAAALPIQAAEALGGLDVIINNAGMTDTSGKPLTELAESTFDKLISLNLTAVQAICESASGVLGQGGTIVNLASGASWRPLALRGPYSATKAGVLALTETFANRYETIGISVSAVAPGYTLTPLVQSLSDQGLVDLERVVAAIPLGRIVKPDDIASAIAFLAASDGRVLSGQTLLVDGGGLAGPAPAIDKSKVEHAVEGKTALIAFPEEISSGSISGQIKLQEIEQVKSTVPLSSVIDFTLLKSPCDPETTLAYIRECAVCISNTEKARDFSLLILLGEGSGFKASTAIAAGGMLAKTISLEWAASGFRVNVLQWRGPVTADLLPVCNFLASGDAAMITGQVIKAKRLVG